MIDECVQLTTGGPATDDEALTFFREIVGPTVAEFLDRPDDRRLGCLACLCLASMADHFFHARAERDGCCDARAFRRRIAAANWAVGQVIGIANATKHVERRPGRVGYHDIAPRQIACGNLRAGWPINGRRVMVEAEGRLWLLSHLVKAAFAFWQTQLELRESTEVAG
jgi:hypothetical protein